MHEGQSEANDGSTVDLIYGEVKGKLAEQIEHTRALDRKAELVLSTSSLLIAAGAGLKAILGPPAVVRCPATTALSMVMFSISAAFYIATMLLGLRAYTPREFHRQVRPRKLREEYLRLGPEQAKRKLMANLVKAFGENRKVITGQKVPSLRWAFYCLLAETLSLSVALVLSAL